MYPRARTGGLVSEEMKDEILIYDLKRHKAHCLTRTVGLIWKQCDGRTSIQNMVSKLQKDPGLAPIDEDIVWMGLHRLGKAHLLVEQPAIPPTLIRDNSRRQMMKKVALVGGVSILSLLVPTAAQAASQCVSCEHQFDEGVSEVGRPCCTGGICHMRAATGKPHCD